MLISALTVFTLIYFYASVALEANQPMQIDTLDGKSFAGKLRGTGWFSLLNSRSTLSFNDGLLTWTGGEDFEAAPYVVRKEGNAYVFTARAIGRAGTPYAEEYVEWRGSYDGHSLNEVIAVWTRVQGGGDWLHDLLLPNVVTFVFEQQRRQPEY